MITETRQVSLNVYLDLVREKLQLGQAMEFNESPVLNDRDVVAVHREVGELGEVSEDSPVDVGEVVLPKIQGSQSWKVGEGVCLQSLDGVTGEGDLRKAGRVGEVEGHDPLDGSVLNLAAKLKT